MLIAELESDVERLARVARAVDARRPGRGRRPGTWTEREIVAHLVRVEREVFQVRLRQLALEREPRWAWAEPGAGPGHASLATLIARFGAARSSTLAVVSALDEAGWARSGVHATYGRLDVAALLAVALAHDREHLADLQARSG